MVAPGAKVSDTRAVRPPPPSSTRSALSKRRSPKPPHPCRFAVTTLLLHEIAAPTSVALHVALPSAADLGALCRDYLTERDPRIDNAQWAARLNLCERAFSRRFRAEMGVSPAAFTAAFSAEFGTSPSRMTGTPPSSLTAIPAIANFCRFSNEIARKELERHVLLLSPAIVDGGRHLPHLRLSRHCHGFGG